MTPKVALIAGERLKQLQPYGWLYETSGRLMLYFLKKIGLFSLGTGDGGYLRELSSTACASGKQS